MLYCRVSNVVEKDIPKKWKLRHRLKIKRYRKKIIFTLKTIYFFVLGGIDWLDKFIWNICGKGWKMWKSCNKIVRCIIGNKVLSSVDICDLLIFSIISTFFIFKSKNSIGKSLKDYWKIKFMNDAKNMEILYSAPQCIFSECRIILCNSNFNTSGRTKDLSTNVYFIIFYHAHPQVWWIKIRLFKLYYFVLEPFIILHIFHIIYIWGYLEQHRQLQSYNMNVP